MLPRIDVKYFKQAVGIERLGKETDLDISARCPVCGDSKINRRTKRLHLYKKGDFVLCNCFNGDCPVQNKTMYTFLRDFFPSLLDSYKRENFRETLNELSSGNSGNSDVFGSLGKSETQETQEKVNWDDWGEISENKIIDCPIKDFINLDSVFKDVSNYPEAINYLKSRGIEYNNFKWYFAETDLQIGETLYKTNNSIIIPLTYEDKAYGFYSRSINSKFFSTYMSDANIGYKIWNYFNIDKSKPVYVFEGIFDALSSGLDNCIALLGAKLPKERLSEIDAIFVLDNDRTGLKNSLELSQKNKVYVQPREYREKDMNQLKLNNPDLDIPNLINSNLYQGIVAKVKISSIL